MKFRDIPQMTKTPIYAVDIPWGMLESWVEREEQELGLQLEPDFQRGHVWSDAQRIAFVEYKLRGGQTGRQIYLNHPEWGYTFKGEFVLVDGLQRLTAVRRFLRSEFPVFGAVLRDYEDGAQFLRGLGLNLSFRINVNNLKTRAEVLRWYLEMNTGGTPHSAAEIARVKALYEQAARERGAVNQ